MGARRISDQVLLILSAIGGSISALISIFIVRHKNTESRFTKSVLSMFFIHMILLWLIEMYVD